MNFGKAVGKKWTTLLGVDGIISYNLRKTTFDSNFDIVTTSTEETSFGGSPFFGFEFQINQHIRLSTELSFSMNRISRTTSNTFQNFSEFNDTITDSDLDYKIESPGFIYLTIRL